MPWCPRCDEIFPGGATCPRCRTRLEAPDAGPSAHGLQPVEDLPQLKVPRRYRRAFERLSEPKAPSQRLLVVAAAALVFAVGFLSGRTLSQPPSTPTVQALPPTIPLSALEVEGAAAYLLWSPGERIATIATHDLYSGDVSPRARLSPPAADVHEESRVSALGRDVAVVVGRGNAAFVAVAPAAGAPFGWVAGVEAAWESPGSLLVRRRDGVVTRWSASPSATESLPGRWSGLVQTQSGAALRRGNTLVRAGDTSTRLEVPSGARVLAISPDFQRAVVGGRQVSIWDGDTARPLRVEGFRAVGASFSAAGDRIAVTLRDDEGALLVGVSDATGNVSLKPVPAQAGECAAHPAWDARGRWVYLAPGDGSVYAVEAAGGRVEAVPTRAVGCGLTWVAS